MNKRTRLKITLAIMLIISIFGLIGLFQNMENLAITATGSLMTSLGLYVWGQSIRPTKSNRNDK